jgi:hypothetical protein
LKNLAAGCEESSIPMERKLTYSRSLAPKHASGNALAVGFTKRKIIFTVVFPPAGTGREFGFACYKSI